MFLDASNWSVDRNFADKAMTPALYRQAYGLVQHHLMGVSYKLPGQLPPAEIETLDQLATALFAV